MGLMHLVERVQHRATRLVEAVRHEPCQERLQMLELPSLYYRCRRGDMIHTYQLFHGGIDANQLSFFTLADGPTRGHPYKICKRPATSSNLPGVQRFQRSDMIPAIPAICHEFSDLPSPLAS